MGKKKNSKILSLGSLISVGAIVALAAVSCSSSQTQFNASLITQNLISTNGETRYISSLFNNDNVILMSSSSSGAGFINRGIQGESEMYSYFNVQDSNDVLILPKINSSNQQNLRGEGNLTFLNSDNATKTIYQDAILSYLLQYQNFESFVDSSSVANYLPWFKDDFLYQDVLPSSLKNYSLIEAYESLSEENSQNYFLPTYQNGMSLSNDIQVEADALELDINRGNIVTSEEALGQFYDNLSQKVDSYTYLNMNNENSYSNSSSNLVISHTFSQRVLNDVIKIFQKGWENLVEYESVNPSSTFWEDWKLANNWIDDENLSFPIYYDEETSQVSFNSLPIRINNSNFIISFSTLDSSNAINDIYSNLLGDVVISDLNVVSEIHSLGYLRNIYQNQNNRTTIQNQVLNTYLKEGEMSFDNDSETLYSLPILKSVNQYFLNRKLLNQFLANYTSFEGYINGDGIVKQGIPSENDLEIEVTINDGSDRREVIETRQINPQESYESNILLPLSFDQSFESQVSYELIDILLQIFNDVNQNASQQLNVKGEQLYFFGTDSFQYNELFSQTSTTDLSDFIKYNFISSNYVLGNKEMFINTYKSGVDLLLTGLQERKAI